MKVHEKDLIRGDGLDEELAKHEKIGRKKMEEGVSKTNDSLLETYPGLERAKILRDVELIVEWQTKVDSLYYRRQDFQDTFYRERENIIRAIEQNNLGYINSFSDSILEEAKRILGLREYAIVKRETNMFTEHGTQIYTLNHNYTQIGKVVQMLAETNKNLRAMRLSPLRKIKETFEKAIQGIPENFPLTDEKVCNENEFFEFQAERSNVIFDVNQRYYTYNRYPGFLPPK